MQQRRFLRLSLWNKCNDFFELMCKEAAETIADATGDITALTSDAPLSSTCTLILFYPEAGISKTRETAHQTQVHLRLS
jgi:hypothetical protein